MHGSAIITEFGERRVRAMVARYVLRGLLTLILLALATPFAFLAAAKWREGLPPGRAGMPGNYIRADGLDIHYESWGPEGGPVILLIHGTIAWSHTFAPIAERLAAKGYHVIAPDMPPFGYSTRPEDGDYSRQALARRIIAFSNALNLKRVTLVGHSFGGGGTVEAAMRNPELVTGLVLLDPALRLSAPNPAKPLGGLMEIPFLGDAVIASTFANPLLTGHGLRSFVQDARVATAELVALYGQPLDVDGTTAAIRNWYLTGLFGDERTALSAKREPYRFFNRPVLLIWGREDTVTPLEQGLELRDLFPRSRLAILPGVNHIPQIEDPDRTAELIADFGAEVSWLLRV